MATSPEDLKNILNFMGIRPYIELLDDSNFTKFHIGMNVIFMPEKDNKGHWILVIYYPHNGYLEFFDSYGLYPGKEFKYSDVMNRNYGQYRHKLQNMILKTGLKEFIYNEKALQSYSDLCGWWVVARIYYFMKGYSQEKFIKKIRNDNELKKWIELNFYNIN